MLGNLVQRLQMVGSPLNSPIASPRQNRRRYAPAQRRLYKQDYREVQSEPEDADTTVADAKKLRTKRFPTTGKSVTTSSTTSKRSLEISGPFPLHPSKSMGRLDGINQVHRLSEYEQYFQALLNETRLQDQRDHDEIAAAKARCKQAVKKGERQSDLERIQDLFPNDFLKLYDSEVSTMKVKGLMRKRPGAAARLQRALSTKSLRSDSPPPTSAASKSSAQQPNNHRQFLMEAPVHFTAGVQIQERHLFLFSDLLLVAKSRSGGNFKLKDKVRISEIWMSKCCLDEVTELTKSEDTSFVLGWPTTNVVVSFGTQAARDLWWNKLQEVFRAENAKEPCSTNIRVTYYDNNTSVEYCKTFGVGPEETARDCVKLALEQLDLGNLDARYLQLWAKTGREESPYPLIGHERPFAIKLSCLRDVLSSEDGFDLDHCNNVHDPVANCHFILRNSRVAPSTETKKSAKKSSARGRIGHVFRRSQSKDNCSNVAGCLYGQPLAKVCDGDNLPKPVANMMYQLFAKGPFTQGIFRKSANARLVRELREKLDMGADVHWDQVPVLVTAAALKDFLRSLPDPLLTSVLYPQWRVAMDMPNLNTRLYRLKGILAQLPKANHALLTHFLCVLHHIARRSCHTLMSAANLGVCVGPSLLWSDCSSMSDDLRVVPCLLETLVTHCQFLCGTHVTSLLGDLRDSGTEESDSMKRDDSSIDSLECSPPPRKDKISLSRDSGLTMSDSQLYTPDEEESGSTSSSGYDPAFETHAKVGPSMSAPNNSTYVRVYGGWEERINPNFQRQAWFRQRSRRMNSSSGSSGGKASVRRTASEESLLENGIPPTTPPRRKCEETPKYPFLNHYQTRRILYQDTPVLRNYRNEQLNCNADLRNENSTYGINSRVDRSSVEENIYTSISKCGNKKLQTLDYYSAKPLAADDSKTSEDSSTLSDDDCTPHVSRSNSRGNEILSQINPPAQTQNAGTSTSIVRGRIKKNEERASHRSRSLPPPPPYRPPPPATSQRAQLKSYYLGSERSRKSNNYLIAKNYADEESYV